MKKLRKIVFLLTVVMVVVLGTMTVKAGSITQNPEVERQIRKIFKISPLGADDVISVKVTRSSEGKYTLGPVTITLEITAVNEIESVTVRTNKEDKTSGEPIAFANNTVTYEVSKNGHWYFLITDKEGNTFDQGVEVATIDRTPATSTKPTVYQTSDTQVMIGCNQKDNESGITEKQYRLVTSASGETSLTGYDWKKSLTFNGLEVGKTYFVQTKVKNGVGLETLSEVTSFSLVLGKVDEVPEELKATPTITVTYSPESTVWAKEEILTIKVTDPKGIKEVTAGVAGSEERTKLSTSTNEGTEKTYTYTVTQNDTKYSIIAINQNDGKKTYSITFHNIDTIPPTDAAPTVTQGSAKNKVKITCNQIDNESRVAKKYYRYKPNGGEYGDWHELSSEIEINKKGAYGFQTKAVDKVGNETISQVAMYTVSVDTEPGSDVISSDKYVIDVSNKKIKKVPPETDKATFIENISVEGAYSVVDESGKAFTEGYIKTGYKLRTGENEYTIIVIGDIAPNGIVDVLDLTRMRSHIVGYEGYILTGNSLDAADISLNGIVDILDLTRMRDIIVGRYTF